MDAHQPSQRPHCSAIAATGPGPSIDGFRYAHALTFDEAEALAASLHADEDELSRLLATPYRESFFAEVSEPERKALSLLTKKALVVALLRGEVPPPKTDRGDKTVGAALMRKFGLSVPKSLTNEAEA